MCNKCEALSCQFYRFSLPCSAFSVCCACSVILFSLSIRSSDWLVENFFLYQCRPFNRSCKRHISIDFSIQSSIPLLYVPIKINTSTCSYSGSMVYALQYNEVLNTLLTGFEFRHQIKTELKLNCFEIILHLSMLPLKRYLVIRNNYIWRCMIITWLNCQSMNGWKIDKMFPFVCYWGSRASASTSPIYILYIYIHSFGPSVAFENIHFLGIHLSNRHLRIIFKLNSINTPITPQVPTTQ